MEDKEIIKALECCAEIDRVSCDFCSFNKECDCVVELTKHALDLINRQKSEIERLTHSYSLADAERVANVKGFTETIATTKSDAVKEFADRLTNEAQTMQSLKTGAYYRAVTDGQIEKIAREMMEGAAT